MGPGAPVRSVSLRKRYAVRGTRLIHLESLLAYLDGLHGHEERKPLQLESKPTVTETNYND